jgi:homoserine O-succinyltransferase
MAIILPQGSSALSNLQENQISARPETSGYFNETAGKSSVTIGFVNLMRGSDRPEVEAMVFKHLADASHDVQPILIHPEADQARCERTKAEYKAWHQLDPDKLDGIIISGFQKPYLPFGKDGGISFWPQLEEIFNYVDKKNLPVVGICWGAFAMSNHFHGIEKDILPAKLLGNFKYKASDGQDLFIPTARLTGMKQDQLRQVIEREGMEILLETHETEEPQIGLFADRKRNRFYTTCHFEYGYEPPPHNRLVREYERDKGLPHLQGLVFPPVRPELPAHAVEACKNFADQFYRDFVEIAADYKRGRAPTLQQRQNWNPFQAQQQGLALINPA